MPKKRNRRIASDRERGKKAVTEAGARVISKRLAKPKVRIKIGSELAAFGKRYGGIELDIKRDRSPIEPAIFE